LGFLISDFRCGSGFQPQSALAGLKRFTAESRSYKPIIALATCGCFGAPEEVSLPIKLAAFQAGGWAEP